MLDDIDSMLDEAITAHEAKDFNPAAAKYTKILGRDAHHAMQIIILIVNR